MADNSVITSITDWLIDLSLADPDINVMFRKMCERMLAAGFPISRAMITYQTLHPVIENEMVVWKRGEGAEMERFAHRREEPDAWRASPLKFMLDTEAGFFRRRLAGPEATFDFPVLEEFADKGHTDYVAMATQFHTHGAGQSNAPRGILVSWCSDRPDGFSDGDIAGLKRIQRRFAVACKMVIQYDITRNIADTYLGHRAADKVLSGQIRRGDGDTMRAVVWYSDVHGSTALADTMPQADYLELLNDYFECTAGAALDAGGEVLSFIGDAVLAIFPVETDADLPEAARAASAAIEDALERSRQVNADRAIAGRRTFRFSIALNLGEVMFGNIGVAQRLSFSVIGPTVNEVARIEKLTRQMDVPALAAEVVGAAAPEYWRRSGQETLAGVAEPVCLFDWSSVH